MENNTANKENGAGNLPAKQAKKVHPLGKLVKIKAHALSPTEKKSQIFCSINEHTIEFQQNTEVEIREAFVKFLQTATKVVHTVRNGKAVTENEPLYAITTL